MKKISRLVSHSLFLSLIFLTAVTILCLGLIIFIGRKITTQTVAASVYVQSANQVTHIQQHFNASQEAVLTYVDKSATSSPQAVKTSSPAKLTPTPSPQIQNSPTPSLSTAENPQDSPIPTSAVTPTQASSIPSQAQEVLDALNAYRKSHGAGALSWNTTLGDYAQSRADLFAANNATDNHAQFQSLISSQDGFKKMGFWGLGENSSFGYPFNAKDLIEKEYASDKPHDDNQLDSSWTDVGIGVNGVATDIVFAKNKM